MASPLKEKFLGSGVVLGWRYWNLEEDVLVSPYKNVPWNKYMDKLSFSHKPKADNHKGFYAYHDYSRVTSDYRRGNVIGLVAGCGDVFLHETGFRAQRMQILALENIPVNFPEWILEISEKETYNLQECLDIKGSDKIAYLSKEEILHLKLRLEKEEKFYAFGKKDSEAFDSDNKKKERRSFYKPLRKDRTSLIGIKGDSHSTKSREDYLRRLKNRGITEQRNKRFDKNRFYYKDLDSFFHDK